MYFKNLIEDTPLIIEGSKNVYLEDERRNNFPYSNIPEHIERASRFKKMIFVNQILDFEKPYIRINDGCISKITAFKDGEDAIVHAKILNKFNNKRTKTISRKELELYLKTGALEQLDEEKYESITIFDMNGKLYNSELESEQEAIDKRKEKLLGFVDENDNLNESVKSELKSAIFTLDEISPFVFAKKLMIKFKQNEETKINFLILKYLERDKYKISLADIPVTKESLSMIKLKFPVIKMAKMPKVKLSLNPNVNKEQLKKEKAKILVRKNNY